MGSATKIDWCEATWNPITICEESQGKEPYCGLCGAQAAESFMDYCPHCGAIMDNQPQTHEMEVE